MRWRSVGGFTLVEVLVALFVLAVGIVGATASQMAAQRARRQSALMSEAVQLAGSLSDRMRANPVVMASLDAANPYLHLDYDAAAGAPSPATPCLGGIECSPAEMARFDLYETTLALREHFPRGRVVVCRDGAAALAWQCQPGAGAPIVVKVGWDAGNGGGRAPLVAMVVPG